MDYETSPIKTAIDEVISMVETEPHYTWTFQFKLMDDAPVDRSLSDIAHTEEEEEGFYTPLSFTNLDFIGDFEKSFCDHVNAQVTVGIGMWLKVLAPSRSHLMVYLIRTKNYTQNGVEDIDTEPLVLVYKALIKDAPDTHETISSTNNVSRFELDTRGLLTLDIDLLDPASEAAQVAACGGTWRDCKASDVMQAVFANVSSQFTFEGEPAITGQFISEGTNEQVRKQITINSGTALVDLPAILQSEHGGIFSSGLNRYLFDKVWYFYPPYDTTRVTKELKTMTVFVGPEGYMPTNTRTYFQDGDNLKIIALGQSSIKDLSQAKFLEQGDGVRYAAATPVAGTWLETKGNKAIATRSKFNSEVRINDPTKTDHRILQGAKRFTDNTFEQMSLLAGRRGVLISLEWGYADHLLLTPGMPATIYHEINGELKEFQGVLQSRNASIQSTQKAATKGTFLTTCMLTFFCNYILEET